MAKSNAKKSSVKWSQTASVLGAASAAVLLPALFENFWPVPLINSGVRWYYGLAVLVTLFAAAWLAMKPRDDRAAGVLTLSTLVVAIPGLQVLAGTVGDSPSSNAWMHVVSTAGPIVLLNVVALCAAMYAFFYLESK